MKHVIAFALIIILKAVDIDWDTDDEDVSLPAEMLIPDGMTNLDDISDYITNKTGFCHCGFEVVCVTARKSGRGNETFAPPPPSAPAEGRDGSITKKGEINMNHNQYGECIYCKCPLAPMCSTEQERDSYGFLTGRVRTICDELYCPECGRTFVVDDTFDGPWHR